jgi:hypothetical protein
VTLLVCGAFDDSDVRVELDATPATPAMTKNTPMSNFMNNLLLVFAHGRRAHEQAASE